MTVPKTITEREFWTAAKPLLDLLGTTPMHIYDFPFPVVTRDEDSLRLHIRLQHVVDPSAEPMDWSKGATGDGEFDEVTYNVDVVVDPAGDFHVVQELWPDRTFPESTLAQEAQA